MSVFQKEIEALIDATCKGTVNEILAARDALNDARTKHGFKEWKKVANATGGTNYFAAKAAADKAEYIAGISRFLKDEAKNSKMTRAIFEKEFSEIDKKHGY